MKRIEVFEKAMNEGGSLKDYGINSTLFAAYRDCQETGNDNIDFNGVIWDYDIPEIVKALKGKRHQRIYDKQYIFKPDRNTCSI